MRWTVESKESKKNRKSQWHICFAILPHRIKYNDGGRNTYAWLEDVGRRYEYRDHDDNFAGWPIFCSKEDAMMKRIAE